MRSHDKIMFLIYAVIFVMGVNVFVNARTELQSTIGIFEMVLGPTFAAIRFLILRKRNLL